MNHPHPSATPPTTHLLGFPRIGARRELKHALEAYWKGTSTFEALEETTRVLRKTHWQAQAAAGLSLLPSNDFSLYDHILDLSCMVGNVPERFGWNGAGEVDPDTYFAMARGRI